jgi:hypothetical protein
MNFDWKINHFCIIKTDDLLHALSIAYRNGHDATVESNYIDPFDIGDISIDLAEELAKRGELAQIFFKFE